MPIITHSSAALYSPCQILSPMSKVANIRSQWDSVNSSKCTWLTLGSTAAQGWSFWWSLCRTGGRFFFLSFAQTTATASKRIAYVLVPHSVRWQILWQEPHGRDVDSGGAQAQPLMHMQHEACSDTLSCGSCWMEVNIANGRVALINWWVWDKRKVWKVPLNKLRGYLWSSSWAS